MTGENCAYIYDGVMTEIGNLGVGSSEQSYGYGINDNDEVVGHLTLSTRPFRYDGSYYDLGVRRQAVYAYDISNSGTMVGYYALDEERGGYIYDYGGSLSC